MKTIKGDLVLKEYTIFNESIKVEGNITGKNGKRFNLTVNGDITAGNISAKNILANNIKAKNIKAYDILSNNILANDITANDITAGNISYYGVCIVYNNIKCKSIKGLGKNSFHETLYGRVYVLKNKVKP